MGPELPLPVGPARHRLSIEDLEPAARSEVAVASFDEVAPPTDEPARGTEETRAPAIADFGAALDPPPTPARVASSGAGSAGGRAASAEPAADTPRLTMEDLRFGPNGGRGRRPGAGSDRGAELRSRRGGEGEPRRRRTPGAPRERGGEGAGADGPARSARAGAAGRGGSRSGVPDDTPGLDTESAAWDAGELRAVGADPDRPARRGARGRGRPRRPRQAEPVEDTRTLEEREADARELCLRLLTDRARSKHELGTRLRQKGVADEIAEKVLERFDEVGLIDDEAFAGAWVRSRHRHRGLGRRAIAQELRHKGIDKDTADGALGEVDDEAEAQRARELVDRKLRTVTVGSPEERRKVGQRLLGMLARKGYPPGIAYGVVRTALAEHGADEDELGPADPD